MFWNLLSNAIKFSERDSVVDGRVECDGAWVTVEIHDTGRGIDPAVVPFVFDRFRQADGSSTRGHGGLGLGPSIVGHIVEAHGGEVSAGSQGAGHGARFSVRLPIASASSDRRAGHDRSGTPDDVPRDGNVTVAGSVRDCMLCRGGSHIRTRFARHY